MQPLQPRMPLVSWKYLGRQIKIWRHYHISDAHALKLLRLWLGYEFSDLMDEYGRIPLPYFNELRRRLCYKTHILMIDDIKRSNSFFIVGSSENNISAIFSPLWHVYESADGTLLSGPENADESQMRVADATVLYNSNNIYNPNGVTAEAVSFDEGCDQRDVFARRNIIKNYFAWLNQQTDIDHKSLVEDIKYQLQHAFDKKGNEIKEHSIKDEEVADAYKLFIDKFMIPYFSRRQDFFKPDYMSHPEKRIYWLRNFFKRSMSSYGAKVRYLVMHKRKEEEQRRFREAWYKIHNS